jgi:hypothetical protein
VIPSWTADSPVVTADSPTFTADGSGGLLVTPQFPNVPALPGVPPLARMATAAAVAAGATLAGETAAIAAALGLPGTIVLGTPAFFAGLGLSPLAGPGSAPSQVQAADANPNIPSGILPSYGISTSDNLAVLTPDSVLEAEIDADSSVNSHPVEQGGFEAYNRVQEPISIRLLMACQGKNMKRPLFLSTLESLREGTQIVTVSTPDASYPNMVLKGYGYKKKAENGAVTIFADTRWVEERSTNVVISVPPTTEPQGASMVDLGSLTPVEVTAQYQGILQSVTPTPAPLPALYNATSPPSGYSW